MLMIAGDIINRLKKHADMNNSQRAYPIRLQVKL